MPRIVQCRFPFPPQDPPLSMPENCTAKCPNADLDALRQHALIREDDEELRAALWSFARWLYDESDEKLEEQVAFAAQLYTRPDHDGTCIPKTLLFAHYKHLQFNSCGPALKLSEAAAAAVRGNPVPSWPDGEPAAGQTWDEMFGNYGQRYE